MQTGVQVIKPIKQLFLWSFLLVLIGMITLLTLRVSHAYSTLRCQHITVVLDQESDQKIFKKQKVIRLMQSMVDPTSTNCIGRLFKQIDAQSIGQCLVKNPLIQQVYMYKTWQGGLHVYLKTNPILACLKGTKGNKVHCIDQRGAVFTASLPASLHVPLPYGYRS